MSPALARSSTSSSSRKPGDRRDRAEVLLGEDLHVVGDVGEHRRLEEEAGVEGRARPPPATTRAPAFTASAMIALDLAAPAAADDRAHLHRRVEAVAELQRLRARGEAVDEGVVQALVDEEAVGGDADLAGVGELGRHRDVQRRLEVGVVVDDERRVAAEFHRHLLHGVGGVADHLLADARRAGQRHLAHERARP